MTDESLRAAFDEIDTDKSGTIEYDEFLDLCKGKGSSSRGRSRSRRGEKSIRCSECHLASGRSLQIRGKGASGGRLVGTSHFDLRGLRIN